MLSAAKHLVCRANRPSSPEMLRGAQHDMKRQPPVCYQTSSSRPYHIDKITRHCRDAIDRVLPAHGALEAGVDAMMNMNDHDRQSCHVMLSAAKHLRLPPIRASRPEMLRCAQHDMMEVSRERLPILLVNLHHRVPTFSVRIYIIKVQ